MTVINPELVFTLDQAVDEVLGGLTGLELSYVPELSRYRSVARQLNKALRSNALEHEWSYYSTTVSAGQSISNDLKAWLPINTRMRGVGDDAVRLVDADGQVMVWAYILPRDALHKYWGRPQGLWCSVTRNEITFSRPFYDWESGLDIQVPVMREPSMFRLPAVPDDPDDPLPQIPDEIRSQPLDFCYPDVICLRAAWLLAQTDPVMQPRAQYLEGQFKDLMYQIIERDDRTTDSPYLNEFFVPIQNSLVDQQLVHLHPHSDERRL